MAPSIINCNQETLYHELHLTPSPTPLNLTFLSLLFRNTVLFNHEPMNVHPLGISTHAFNYSYHDRTYHIERPIRIKFKPICYLHPLYTIHSSPMRVAEVDPQSQCLLGTNILGIALIGLGLEERFAIISPDSSSFEILTDFSMSPHLMSTAIHFSSETMTAPIKLYLIATFSINACHD
jgi:hypothetical protein